MPTITKRPSRAHKQPAAPFSQAAAKLIKQIQIEAREQLLIDLSAKDDFIVLHGFDAVTKRLEVNDGEIGISDGKGNRTTLFRRYSEPDAWRNAEHMKGYWHPARWYGDHKMVDSNGTSWFRDNLIFVCNDFGDLVEVAA